jgi:hypothetical protein
MKSYDALQEGARRVLAARRMALLFLLANLALALVCVLPVAALLGRSLGASAASAGLTAHLDVLWLEDFVYQHGDALASLLPLFAAATVAYLVLDVFLLGGALGTFHSGEPFSMRGFLSHALANFSILLRLTLLSLVFYAAALLVYSLLADALTGDLGRTSATEKPLVLTDWALYAALALALLLVNMWFSYAKVLGVAGVARGALRTSWRALKFIARRPSAWGLYFALLVLQTVVAASGLYALGLLPQTSFLLVVAGFLAWEAFLLLRIGVWLTAYASQNALCRLLLDGSEESERLGAELAAEQVSVV